MKNQILSIFRPEIVSMVPYRSARSQNNTGIIFLDANENKEILPGYENLNQYPSQQPAYVLNLLSTLYAVDFENILVTRGSDEAIDLLVRAT